jgi:hypothetical protein
MVSSMTVIRITNEAYLAIRDIDGPDPDMVPNPNLVKIIPGNPPEYDIDMEDAAIEKFKRLGREKTFGPIPANESFSDMLVRLSTKLKEHFGVVGFH